MHDADGIGHWLALLRDGTVAEQQLARTELGLILEARGLLDEAAEAYARNVQDGVADRRPYERLAALARQRGDTAGEAQAWRALANLLAPPVAEPEPEPPSEAASDDPPADDAPADDAPADRAPDDDDPPADGDSNDRDDEPAPDPESTDPPLSEPDEADQDDDPAAPDNATAPDEPVDIDEPAQDEDPAAPDNATAPDEPVAAEQSEQDDDSAAPSTGDPVSNADDSDGDLSDHPAESEEDAADRLPPTTAAIDVEPLASSDDGEATDHDAGEAVAEAEIQNMPAADEAVDDRSPSVPPTPLSIPVYTADDRADTAISEPPPPPFSRWRATLIWVVLMVVVVAGALAVPVSQPFTAAPAEATPAPSPTEGQIRAAAFAPAASPSPSPSPIASPSPQLTATAAPSPTLTPTPLPARCKDAALRFPESRDSDGSVRAAFREFLARQGVTIDPASTLFAGLAEAYAARHAEVVAGWMAVTLQRERRGLPAFPLVDYVASDVIVAVGPGEYRLRATVSPQGWSELRALSAQTCEGAFLHNPENARWVELMQASVGDITWALPTPQPGR